MESTSPQVKLRVLEGMIQSDIRKGARALMAIAALYGINAVNRRTHPSGKPFFSS